MKDFLNKVSDDYFVALRDARVVHEGAKFSGKFLRPHAKYVKELIDRFGIKSILDYGCGKGQQYEWVIPKDTVIEQWGWDCMEKGPKLLPSNMTLEEYWGIEVTKYDPAVEKFKKEPDRPHDLVICSHVLGAIPVVDMPVVVERLYSLTNKILYVVEAIGAIRCDGKPVKNWTEVECPLGWTAIQWLDVLGPPKPKGKMCELAVRYRATHGTYIGRFRL